VNGVSNGPPIVPTGSGWTTNWSQTAPGFYTFEAVATDNDGLSSASEPVTVVVTTSSVNPPVAMISNLPVNDRSEFGVPALDLPVIREALFPLQGTADGDSPVAYQVLLYRPEDWETIGDLSELIGSIEPYADVTPAGPTNYQGFHTGSVINDNLGTLDLTAFPNGIYDLVLRVRGGTDETNTIVRVQLESNLKIGQFSFSEQDLAVPVNGIPLTIVRTYNSLNPRSGDFGHSWTYTLNSMEVQLDESRRTIAIGSGDVISLDPFEGVYPGPQREISIRTGGSRDVTLTLPDGRRATFAFRPEFHSADMYAEAKWDAPPGVTEKLERLNDSGIINLAYGIPPFWQDGGENSTFDNHDLDGWKLTALDGTEYHITRGEAETVLYQESPSHFIPVTAYDAQPKLTRIIQRSGDHIEISDTGLRHYNATNGLTRSVFIERDLAGRIVAIHDPNAGSNGLPVVKYVYNRDTGNLIQVHRLQDRVAGNYLVTKYHYDHPKFPHYLTSIEDPRGVPLARNEYDDSGKLIAVVDADGRRTELRHSTSNKVEVVTDRLGHTNSFVYDLRGNVTFITNALQSVAAMGYDDLNQQTAETNALGTAQETWSLYTYDPSGYQTQVVTSPDHTNSFSYDDYGNLLTQTDALGNSTTNGFDEFGNLTTTVQLDSNNGVVAKSSSTYLDGHLVETRNASDQVMATFGYDSMGNLTSTTDANGVSRGFTYDANGNQTSSYYTWTPPGGGSPKSVTNRTEYDAHGRAVRTIDGLGNTNQTFYNALGKVDHTIDKFGNTNSFLYDPRGNLIQTTHADGLVTHTVYDDNGRAFLTTERNGIIGTRSYYDSAGRVTNTVRLTNVVVTIEAGPRSVISNAGTGISTNSTEYFPSGWVKSRTGPDNQKTTYAYWPDGQLMYVTNALNQTTFYQYDLLGRQDYVVDALNRTNRFEYDAVGRMIKTIFANNSWTSNSFNLLGQRTAVTDQAQLVTQFGYDVSGQLTNVIKPQVPDPVGGTNFTPEWAYTYDVYGRLRATADPKSHSTTNTYDEFGRPVSRFLPMGGNGETNTYNHLGQLTNRFDFKGQRTRYIYDRFGRTATNYFFATGEAYPSNSVAYFYNHLGQLTNIIECFGDDASSGYIAAVGGPGMGGGSDSIGARLLASLAGVPGEAKGGVLALILCGIAFACVPRTKVYELWAMLCMASASSGLATLQSYGRRFTEPRTVKGLLLITWQMMRRVGALGGSPGGTPRRLRLPSFWWRAVSVTTLICFLGSDPAFQGLWNAQAACDIPTNISTDTTRITTYAYDLEGRLAQVDSPEGVINYEYDLATGRLTRTCTLNSEFAYEYDALGRLWKVYVLKRDRTPVSESPTVYTYTAVGSRETVTLPNGVQTTYQYDQLNRLTNLVNSLGGTNLLSQFSYQLHGTGRRTNAVEVLKIPSGEGGGWQTNTLSWQFDGLYRLTNEVCVTTAANGSYTNRYQYDKAGNRWQKVLIASTGTTTITNLYNANDQLLKEVKRVDSTLTETNSYAYDANGSMVARTNITSGGTTTMLYGYDLKNKLSTVQQAGDWHYYRFIYNEAGMRVRTMHTAADPILYLVDGNNHTGYAQVLEELSSGLGAYPDRTYTLGDDVLADAPRFEQPGYLLYDGHGSMRQVFTSGNVTSRYNYDAYGQTLSGTSSISTETKHLYCGEQYDFEAGMYNLRARFYDPSNGRFNAMDSFSGYKMDPQSLHKYAYCHDDPVNGIDPSGLFLTTEQLMTISIVAVIAAAITVVTFLGTTYYHLSSGDPGLALTASFRVGAQAVGIFEAGIDFVYMPKTDKLYWYWGFDSGFAPTLRTKHGAPFAWSATVGVILGIDEPDEWSGNSVTATVPLGGLIATRFVRTNPGHKGLRGLLGKLRHLEKRGDKYDFVQVGVSTSGPSFFRVGGRSNAFAWEVGWLSEPHLASEDVWSAMKQIFNVGAFNALIDNPGLAFDYATQLEISGKSVVDRLIASDEVGNDTPW